MTKKDRILTALAVVLVLCIGAGWQQWQEVVLRTKAGNLLAIDSDGDAHVKVEDKYTEIVDLHLTKIIQTATVVSGVSVDGLVLTVTTVAEPTDGSMVCLKEGTAFYQGEIISHAANTTNWDVTLDTPFDYAFTTAADCCEESEDMNVNGSSTPQIFRVTPTDLTSGTTFHINRMMAQIEDNVAMDDAKFGGITALTNGVVVRSKNGIYKNVFNAKSNGDFAAHAYDITYSDKAPAGSYGFRVRRSFNGQDKNGVVIHLDSDTSDEFQVIVQDDLTGLTKFHVIAQGHIHSE